MELDAQNLSFSFFTRGTLEFELVTGDIIKVTNLDDHTARVYFDKPEISSLYRMCDSSKRIVPPVEGYYLIVWTESYTLYPLTGDYPVLNLTQKRELDVKASGCKKIKFHDRN